MLDPETLIEEVSGMEELGESVAGSLFPEFIRSLFETGRAMQGRSEIDRRLPSLDPAISRRTAWVCYRGGVWDLACVLFLRSLEANSNDYKLLSALEAAARRCGRVQEVAAAYESLRDRFPHLHGRRRGLLRRP